MPVTRPLVLEDAAVLASLVQENREFLAPWQPVRPDRYFTREGQADAVQQAVERRASGTAESLAIVDATNEVVGTISLQSIIRGAFQSCTVGYWLAESAQGQGLATQALREAVDLAFGDLRLHRVQAETMARNVRSQRVLDRAGFVRYGHAETYMHIAGEWQDNLLYQVITPTPERVVTN
jgi:ribosomal-protein-alanine N-acetyltransferase